MILILFLFWYESGLRGRSKTSFGKKLVLAMFKVEENFTEITLPVQPFNRLAHNWRLTFDF
jgi:hypothetical protein